MAHTNKTNGGSGTATFKIQFTEQAPAQPTGRVWVDWKRASSKSEAFSLWNSVRQADADDVQAVQIVLVERVVDGREYGSIIAFASRTERDFILPNWK